MTNIINTVYFAIGMMTFFGATYLLFNDCDDLDTEWSEPRNDN